MAHLCKVDGCEIYAHARGWCSKHYMRWHRTGSPFYPNEELQERVWRLERMVRILIAGPRGIRLKEDEQIAAFLGDLIPFDAVEGE